MNRDVRLCFFSERVINNWNMLDQTVVDACSVDVCKKRRHTTRKNRIDLCPHGPRTDPGFLLVWLYQVKKKW